ncbi:unnamed protein product [Fusarium graminearum]|uniref:Uncharacterized protein n=1 Tax=Gibberella zeae TaxID=5518 RepID=A0A9N8RI15_GIBZA|nr:unnamed protein product [Fusarium graminearum]CAG2011844.1 unnamed protein product [Fusarium graminearum]
MSQYDDNASHSAWKQAVRTIRSKFKEAGARAWSGSRGPQLNSDTRRKGCRRGGTIARLYYIKTPQGGTHIQVNVYISDGLEHDRFYKFN